METILIWLAVIFVVLILIVDVLVRRQRMRVFWAFLMPVYSFIFLMLLTYVSEGRWDSIMFIIPLIYGGIVIVANTTLAVVYLYFTKRLSDCLNQKEKRRIWITLIAVVFAVIINFVLSIPNIKIAKEEKEFFGQVMCNSKEETIERWEQQMRSEGDWGITEAEVGFAHEYMKINKEICEENREEREAIKERERIEAEKTIEHPAIVVPVI